VAETAAQIYQRHHNNLNEVASKVITKELETNAIRRHVSKDQSVNTITYQVALEIMLESQDHFDLLSRYLANVTAARNYFKRTLDFKEKNLLGNPDKQEGARNIQTREYRMVQDEGYQTLYSDLRVAEELQAYLERLENAALETLNVSKKIYDTASKALERERAS
jgi:phosphoglycolate phosphatase-like HAD superfamily hydrolase